MSRILPYLFLGGKADARNFDFLTSSGITVILNMTPLKTFDASGVPCYFENDRRFRYHRIALLDSTSEKILPILRSSIELIDRARHYGSVLVHCNQGVSRSAAICCAYLIRYRGMSLQESLAYIKKRRATIRPNDGFIAQLETFETDVAELRRLGGIVPPEPITDAFSQWGSCDEVSDAGAMSDSLASVAAPLAGSKRLRDGEHTTASVSATLYAAGTPEMYGPQASPMSLPPVDGISAATALSNPTSHPDLLCEECASSRATVLCSACLVAYCDTCDTDAHSLPVIGAHEEQRQPIQSQPSWLMPSLRSAGIPTTAGECIGSSTPLDI
jgi:hypothetical protein